MLFAINLMNFFDRQVIIPLLASILAIVLFAASRTVTGDVRKLQAWLKLGVDSIGSSR